MILDNILDTLFNDLELKTLLKGTLRDSKIHMFGTTEGVSYKFVPIASDGVKRQDRLEITVIHPDYEIAVAILERIKKLLITVGDKPFNNQILKITQNGGGAIENHDTHNINLLCFFIVKSRE